MRVVFEEDLRSQADDALALATRRSVCLMDLHLPCNMRCDGCTGPSAHPEPLTPQVREALVENVLARADEESAEHLDLALYGGEPLLDLEEVLALSSSVKRRCGARGVTYDGHLITNGTLLAEVAPRRLVAAGLKRVQVTLDGLGPRHDCRQRMLDGAGTFERIVEGLRRARGTVSLLVRAQPDALTPEVETLLCALDSDGLLAGDPDVALYVARPAPYAQQARDLVRIFPLLEQSQPPPRA